MHFEGTRRPARPIPLTPLIDVVFLLLIFFMLTSRFLDLGAVSLEAAGAGEPAEAAEAIRVDLGADGLLTVGGAAVARDALGDRLRALLRDRPGAAVVVAPEAAVSVDALVSVLDEVRRSGAEPVTLARGAPAPEA